MTLVEALRETLDGGFTDADVEALVPRWPQTAPGGGLPRPDAVAWTEEVALPLLREANSKRLAATRRKIGAIVTQYSVTTADGLILQRDMPENTRADQARLLDNLRHEIARGEILERRRAPEL